MGGYKTRAVNHHHTTRQPIALTQANTKSPTTLPCVFHAKSAMAAQRTQTTLQTLRTICGKSRHVSGFRKALNSRGDVFYFYFFITASYLLRAVNPQSSNFMSFTLPVHCRKKILSAILFFLVIPSLFAQESGLLHNRPFTYEASVFFTGSGSETPFWHYANTDGLIQSGSSFNNLNSLQVAMPFRENPDGKLDLSAGAKLTSRLSDTGNTIHFQQLYGSLQFGVMRLTIGRFYGTVGLNMTELSTGSMMQSRNATPIPKISIDMTRFVDIPLTNGIVQFKGHYSDGKLEDDRFVDSPFVHQKSAYLKFNIKRLEAIAGFVHNVQWGGTDPRFGKLPQSFGDYLRVVVGKSADPESDAPGLERTNRLGNTVAAYDGSLRYNFDKFTILGYRMIYVEDTVSLELRSFWDGTYGLGFRMNEDRTLFSGVLYEFMNTIQQDSQGNFPRGRANYYSHSLYRSGWTFNGNVIGNPLIRFDRESGRIDNNMIIAHHLGFDGWISNRLQYRAMATYSRNYGICSDQIITGSCFINSDNPPAPNLETIPRSELRRDQYSALIEGNYLLVPSRGIRLHGSFALDTGDFTGESAGVMLGVSWNGRF